MEINNNIIKYIRNISGDGLKLYFIFIGYSQKESPSITKVLETLIWTFDRFYETLEHLMEIGLIEEIKPGKYRCQESDSSLVFLRFDIPYNKYINKYNNINDKSLKIKDSLGTREPANIYIQTLNDKFFKVKKRVDRVNVHKNASALLQFFKEQRLKTFPEITFDSNFNLWENRIAQKLFRNYPKLTLQDWKDAIIWFMENEFWAPKLHSLRLVERHIQQFLATRSTKQTTRSVDVIK
tara:strand:- start:26287 stop:27000 length:714 start_codon:yes stop_codon:yes gene_type:complete